MCAVLMLLIREFVHQKARVHNLLSGTQVSSGIVGKFSDAVHERHDIPNILHACTCCGVYIWFSTDATI